jgi:uncharacterized small protein (DUF1192 family)
MMFDDEAPRKKVTHEVGASLDALSISELEARIGLLEAEIGRLKTAIGDRNKTRSAAESLFKL